MPPGCLNAHVLPPTATTVPTFLVCLLRARCPTALGEAEAEAEADMLADPLALADLLALPDADPLALWLVPFSI